MRDVRFKKSAVSFFFSKQRHVLIWHCCKISNFSIRFPYDLNLQNSHSFISIISVIHRFLSFASHLRNELNNSRLVCINANVQHENLTGYRNDIDVCAGRIKCWKTKEFLKFFHQPATPLSGEFQRGRPNNNNNRLEPPANYLELENRSI